jgi:hypothetical protein
LLIVADWLVADSMGAEFVAKGAPKEVALAIEQYAHGQGSVTAIVVPWESSKTMLSMSVTSVKADGWAIEHTNLGTVTLTDAGDGTTAVAVTAHDPDRARGGAEDPTTKQKLARVFEQFAQQIQQRFKT